MWIRPWDLADNEVFRSLVQLLMRTHGFVWYWRHRYQLCGSILHVRLHQNEITVYHTYDSEIYKTTAIWTRIRIPSDLDMNQINVHIMEWPPRQVT